MEKIRVGTADVFLDFFLTGPSGEPLLVSFFDRADQMVRGAGAAILMDRQFYYRSKYWKKDSGFQVFYSTIIKGKEKFTQGIAVAAGFQNEYLVTTKEDCYEDLYYYLMRLHDLPLLKEWMPVLWDDLLKDHTLYQGYGKSIIYGNRNRMLQKGETSIAIDQLSIWRIHLTEDALRKKLSSLLRSGKIWISKYPQKKLVFANLDDYFREYGVSIVENLRNIVHPVSKLNGEIDQICLNTMRLYPQQASMVNGIYEYFRKTKSKYVLFSMGTGSGKTIQAAAAAEMMYVGKWLKSHPKATLADAYEKDGQINYRHIIACPPHMVEKWKKEILREIPYAKPVIVDSFSQLVELRKKGKERKDGKEFYILSFDFLKLSYQRIPVPKREALSCIHFLRCKGCETLLPRALKKCPYCESEEIEIVRSRYMRTGMICPSCNRLLYPRNFNFNMDSIEDPEDENSWPLQWYDFEVERQSNQNCIYCGEELWKPFVKNINTEPFTEPKKPAWIRQTFWANRAHRGKKTLWVLKEMEEEARRIWGEPLNSMEDSVGGCRRYAPGDFIKKYMKGYFDVFITDEIHKTKGGSTAQGNAFHAVQKASKYVFGLTGTIAGGVATDLFYMLFRLEPGRMVRHGYAWGSIMNFAKDYGVVEETFEANVDDRRNTFSKGRQLSQPRVLPGISPKIFSEFLLDRAVFLYVEDMSASMPPLNEYIMLVQPENRLEKEMMRDYKRSINQIMTYACTYHVNLNSIKQQFSMSYLDKPYGAEKILDPKSGDTVLYPPDYRTLIYDGGLLAKEKKLIETVGKELSEGRNCVIYAEYTQQEETNVLPRLKEILMSNLGLLDNEVVILVANHPKASKREHWMHEKAKEGMKVMLCNPRLCETGLDFCWEEQGTIYNYPTLMFYQCGYSLFVTWQASGRHWRLNQREECRTYYFAYEGTVQQAILQVLGEKKAATSAIQGRFSAAGLSAMAKGVDTQVRIAQIMADMDETSGNKLQEMFDVVASDKEDETYGNCKKMQLFHELVKHVAKDANVSESEASESLLELFGGEQGDGLFGLFNQMLGSALQKEQKEENLFYFFDDLLATAAGNEGVSYTAAPKKRRRAKAHVECVSLF